jgi:ribosomal protein L29
MDDLQVSELKDRHANDLEKKSNEHKADMARLEMEMNAKITGNCRRLTNLP